ncbi:hypothetical protein UACE39S_06662 [Ureibacillus acetophenoni]
MDKIFQKIFWGYIIISFDIHIFIDILIDPLGYFMIYKGIKQLVKDFPIANKSKIVSFGLIFYSIPSVILDNTLEWNWYYTIFSFIDLLLVFYIFQLIISIAKAADEFAFEKRAFWTGTVYFISTFIALLISSFVPNLPVSNTLYFITLVMLIAALILEIMFFVLIWRVRKLYVPINE